MPSNIPLIKALQFSRNIASWDVGQEKRRSGSGLVTLHIKGLLPAGSFALSENLLAQEGAISSQLERFFCYCSLDFFFLGCSNILIFTKLKHLQY